MQIYNNLFLNQRNLFAFRNYGFTPHPNVIDIKPEIRIRILSDFKVPLIKPSIFNLITVGYVRYDGTVKAEDVLSLSPDGTALVNGIEIPVEENKFFLPPGELRLPLEAFVGYARGKFDCSLFDYSTFEQESLREIGFSDHVSGFDHVVFAITAPVANIDVTVQKLNPASFTAIIPWDIPGYTEKFNDLPDKPRNQIKYIVNKVKVAGVFTAISYEKLFNEIQEQADKFYGHASRRPLEEDHTSAEANFDIGSMQFPYHNGIETGLSDNFVASGMLDYTQFDPLNTFAQEVKVMKSCEILDMKAQLTIQKRNKDGQIIKEINMNNSIVLSGRDLVAKLFIKEAIAPVSHVAAGKGTKDVDPATDK